MSTERFRRTPTPGPIPVSSLLPYWQYHDEPQVHPASLCVRTETLAALGGWMAVSSSEDTGLLLALNAVSTGYFIGEPGPLYRVWPGQTTAQRVSDDECKVVLRLIGMRADELPDGVGTARSNPDAHQVEPMVTETISNV